jgi:hypothetical protein
MDLDKLQAEIQLASMLLQLGLTTAEKIKTYFAAHSDVNDDAALAAVMAEVNWRIARRRADASSPLP